MKKKIVLLIILVAFAVTGSVAGFLYFNKNAKDDDQGTRAFRKMQFHSSGNNVTATGVTNMGMVSETFDVTGLETELQIEEVYIASGDTLSEGEKVLKITDESLCCAREELENKVLKAELAYRAGTIDYERSKIVAEYERDSKKLSGSQAEAVYNDSIKDAYQDVDSAQRSCISFVGVCIGVLLSLGLAPAVELFSVRVSLSVQGGSAFAGVWRDHGKCFRVLPCI